MKARSSSTDTRVALPSFTLVRHPSRNSFQTSSAEQSSMAAAVSTLTASGGVCSFMAVHTSPLTVYPPVWQCVRPMVLVEYEAHLRRLNRRPLTLRAYVGRMRIFLADHPDWRHLDTLTVERWLDQRQLSPRGRAWWVTLLQGFYRWALDVGEVGDDRAIRSLVRPKVPGGVPRPAVDADIAMALALAAGPMRRAVALMMYAGLRCCEVAALRWIDTDLPAAGLYVEGKGGRTRWVPISAELAEELGPSGRPYAPTIGEQWTPTQVSWRVNRYLRSLGIAATAHQMRHAFASHAYAGTRDIRAVADLLGHLDTKTTRIYVQVDEEALRLAVAAVTYR